MMSHVDRDGSIAVPSVLCMETANWSLPSTIVPLKTFARICPSSPRRHLSCTPQSSPPPEAARRDPAGGRQYTLLNGYSLQQYHPRAGTGILSLEIFREIRESLQRQFIRQTQCG